MTWDAWLSGLSVDWLPHPELIPVKETTMSRPSARRPRRDAADPRFRAHEQKRRAPVAPSGPPANLRSTTPPVPRRGRVKPRDGSGITAAGI